MLIGPLHCDKWCLNYPIGQLNGFLTLAKYHWCFQQERAQALLGVEFVSMNAMWKTDRHFYLVLGDGQAETESH